jgi:DNA-binding transcriptional LysR family regulator
VRKKASPNCASVPSGELKITSSVGLGSHWLTPRLTEFLELYPDIRAEVILTNDELDLAMREADVAVRLRQPVQSDLIQRRLFTVHFHVYGSPEYLKRYGTPQKLEDLDEHRLISFGGTQPSYLLEVHWLAQVGREGKEPRPYTLVVNNITALRNAVARGMGLAVLPDYLMDSGFPLTRVLTDVDMPSLEAYLVYPEEMKSVAKVQVFREFLISNAQRWSY